MGAAGQCGRLAGPGLAVTLGQGDALAAASAALVIAR